MKIKVQLCDDDKELEDFLNSKIDYRGFRPENVILGISQDRMYYTVIYKDLNNE